MADLGDIITSRVRVKMIELFLSDVSEIYHVRGITRATGEEINAVRRELQRLEKAGFVKKEHRGNRLYYWVRKDYPLYGDLLSIVAKSKGVGKVIIESNKRIGKLSFVMFSGKFVRKKTRKDDDVEILFVGNDIVLPEIAAIIRKEESKLDREINYTVMSKDEFIFRKKRRDPFLLGILSESRVMIIGDEDDLVGHQAKQ